MEIKSILDLGISAIKANFGLFWLSSCYRTLLNVHKCSTIDQILEFLAHFSIQMAFSCWHSVNNESKDLVSKDFYILTSQ